MRGEDNTTTLLRTAQNTKSHAIALNLDPSLPTEMNALTLVFSATIKSLFSHQIDVHMFRQKAFCMAL